MARHIIRPRQRVPHPHTKSKVEQLFETVGGLDVVQINRLNQQEMNIDELPRAERCPSPRALLECKQLPLTSMPVFD